MNKIPKIQEPELYKETAFTDCPFVQIVSDECFEVEMQYPLLGLQNAEKDCFVRKEVYEKLVEAFSYLPKEYRFKILDAWRPFALQEELFYKYSAEITKKYHLENVPENERLKTINRFVSSPVNNEILPPIHTTGGAVDITLIDSDGKECDMGSAFDEMGETAYTAYYEDSKETHIADNRRILYNAMISAGFTNLPSEWWHYDYGDRFWGYYTGKPAMYKGVFSRESI